MQLISTVSNSYFPPLTTSFGDVFASLRKPLHIYDLSHEGEDRQAQAVVAASHSRLPNLTVFGGLIGKNGSELLRCDKEMENFDGL